MLKKKNLLKVLKLLELWKNNDNKILKNLKSI